VGTGFVGKHLTARFIEEGNEVTILTCSLKEAGQIPKGITFRQYPDIDKALQIIIP